MRQVTHHYYLNAWLGLYLTILVHMLQWGIHQGLAKEDVDASNPLNPGNFKKVKLLPDGAALFTRGVGMSCIWDTERGFGERSWRYSAVINDMKLEKIFVEVRSIESINRSRPLTCLLPSSSSSFVGRSCGSELWPGSVRSLRCGDHGEVSAVQEIDHYGRLSVCLHFFPLHELQVFIFKRIDPTLVLK